MQGLLFLGDSLTAFHDWQDFGGHYNAGVPGDTTEGLLYRLGYLLDKGPHTVVLMIGINDLLQGVNLETVKTNYRLIIESLEDVGRVILLSNLPITRFADADGLNAKVIVLNMFLKELASTHGLTYLDLYACFKDESGKLKEAYTTDGVHLTAMGYEVWEEQLTSILP